MKKVKIEVNTKVKPSLVGKYGLAKVRINKDEELTVDLDNGLYTLTYRNYRGKFLSQQELKSNVKRLSTINKVARKYDVVFVI